MTKKKDSRVNVSQDTLWKLREAAASKRMELKDFVGFAVDFYNKHKSKDS